MTESEQQPRSAFLGHIAFAILLAIVIARCLMLETLRDAMPVGGTAATTAPAGPGAATSIVLDWLSFLPALLIIGRRLADRSRTLSFNLAHALLFALAAWTLASVFWADDQFLALISATRIAGGAAIFWSGSQLVRRWDHLRVVVGVVVGLLLVNIVQGALYQNVELADLKHYYDTNKVQILADHGWHAGDYTAQRFEMKLRAGEMINFNISANVLGALVVTAALATIGAALQRIEDRDEKGWTGALILIAAGSAYVLHYTGSKASWAALVLGIGLLAGSQGVRAWLARNRTLAFGGMVATVALSAIAIVLCGLARHSLPTDSLNFRWRYWVGSWPLVLERPFTGVGWGNFADAYLRHRLPAAAEEIQDPHSFPVRWLVELGAIGFALGIGWLLTWAWQVANPAPSPGTPREGWGESLSAQGKTLTLTLSRRTGRGNRMGISRVLLALLLALATTLLCTIDFGGDPNYATLETMRRAMFIGLIALTIGLVCLGRRESPDEPFYVDDRPAPWLVAGLLVGVLMMLLQSTIDIALFQPGPWAITMLAMGGLMGLNWRASLRDAASVPTVPNERHGVTPSKRPVLILATIATIMWLVTGLIIVAPLVLAENEASDGDSFVTSQPFSARFMYQKAAVFSPVSNYDYFIKVATALTRDNAAGLEVRPWFDRAVAAAPHHALNWLTRSRYLSSQRDVSPADAQQSIDDFGHAITLNPNDVDLRIEYADLLERFGHRSDAAGQLEAALKADDGLDRAEPKRLALRSPGKYEAIQKRVVLLQGESGQ